MVSNKYQKLCSNRHHKIAVFVIDGRYSVFSHRHTKIANEITQQKKRKLIWPKIKMSNDK